MKATNTSFPFSSKSVISSSFFGPLIFSHISASVFIVVFLLLSRAVVEYKGYIFLKPCVYIVVLLCGIIRC